MAAEAQRHQILVTAAVRKEVGALAAVEFLPIGKRRLKGLADEIEIFEVRPERIPTTARTVDPVCGMDLTPAGVAATLSFEGKDRAFCSEGCLRKFVEAPARYGG